MRVHAIQTGRVKIKQSQVTGRGHGLYRRATYASHDHPQASQPYLYVWGSRLYFDRFGY